MVKVRVVYEEIPILNWEYKVDNKNRCNMCGKKETEEKLNMYAGRCLDCFGGCS